MYREDPYGAWFEAGLVHTPHHTSTEICQHRELLGTFPSTPRPIPNNSKQNGYLKKSSAKEINPTAAQ
jgi:hypothetical protein